MVAPDVLLPGKREDRHPGVVSRHEHLCPLGGPSESAPSPAVFVASTVGFVESEAHLGKNQQCAEGKEVVRTPKKDRPPTNILATLTQLLVDSGPKTTCQSLEEQLI